MLFWVSTDNFLDFLADHNGIEFDKNKAWAIIDTPYGQLRNNSSLYLVRLTSFVDSSRILPESRITSCVGMIE